MTFDILPIDILNLIFVEIDIKTLVLLPKINKFLNDFGSKELLKLIRIKLKIMTKFNTDSYQLKQLYNLYTLQTANISAGETHSLILNSKGKVYGIGSDFFGQLGLGSEHLYHLPKDNITVETIQDYIEDYTENGSDIDTCHPMLIPGVDNIVQIFAGNIHSFVIGFGGKLYAFGNNEGGNLSNRGEYNIFVPTLIPLIEEMKYVTAGNNITLAISQNAKLYACGLNKTAFKLSNYISDSEYIHKFDIIPDICDIIDVSANTDFSFILTSDNKIYCFGAENVIIIFNQTIIKISAGDFGIAALDSTGQVHWSKNANSQFILIPELINIIDVSVSEKYALALNNNGKVYIWGNLDTKINYHEKIDNPILLPSLSNIIKISAGRDHVLMLDYNGSIYSAGDNKHGQLGLGDRKKRFVPTMIPNMNLL